MYSEVGYDGYVPECTLDEVNFAERHVLAILGWNTYMSPSDWIEKWKLSAREISGSSKRVSRASAVLKLHRKVLHHLDLHWWCLSVFSMHFDVLEVRLARNYGYCSIDVFQF
jgi:hypothetical protein